ncbi:hypothetical protein ACLIBH_01190 [Virgibacillus sp. W0430]|uniref:hypothetical protein n=1 Tax=Virgibacillus sp. W0430 TaxID=3391580 RepID=UPI003F4567C7
MSVSRILKWISGSCEALLAIPFIGGAFVIGLYWTPLLVMLILHIVTLILTKKDGGPTAGSIIGIITSCIGWVPILGWIMHVISAIFLMINAAKPDPELEANGEVL